MYSYGLPHMAKQTQDNQLEHTYSSYVRIRDVALKTCQRRWRIGEKWRERVRDIRASGTTWWWWWFHLTLLIHLHSVKWFQVLLCITNNLIKDQSFVYTQLSNRAILFLTIWHTPFVCTVFNVKQFYLTHRLDLSGANTPDQGGPRSNGNEGVLYIPKSPVVLEPHH